MLKTEKIGAIIAIASGPMAEMSELSSGDRDVMLRVLVTREFANRVQAEASREGRSLSAMIELLLAEALDERHKS